MGGAKQTDQTKRQRILNAATELFTEHGYTATTLAMIAAKAGTVVGSVTHFCRGKPDIAAAIHETIAASLSDCVLNALEQSPDRSISAWVRRVVVAAVDWTDANVERLILLDALGAELMVQPDLKLRSVDRRLADLLAARTEIVRIPSGEVLDGAWRYSVVLAPLLAHARLRGRQPSAARASQSQVSIDLLCAAAIAGLAQRSIDEERVGETDRAVDLFSGTVVEQRSQREPDGRRRGCEPTTKL